MQLLQCDAAWGGDWTLAGFSNLPVMGSLCSRDLVFSSRAAGLPLQLSQAISWGRGGSVISETCLFTLHQSQSKSHFCVHRNRCPLLTEAVEMVPMWL